ncbi:chromosome partitioning protein ParB [Sphingobium sp. Leaf26]|uniref:ParB/RepB/Spo0J family partition protein n=1 Tax=Sphingobium sp. Leaf26 TaxID=1735693 RepID=UPI0006FED9C5|nr:ParB/RepB/Spo0J family partition protein [Sphingobium sp. Leaf26]KQN07113.1 chromosome partitioning protein ParB [Sphingobium sp. Leaf26]
MKLDFIPLSKLSISKTNMRFTKTATDVSDILPTVRRRGVIQPIIVRPNCAPDAYEIVAGSRRFHAALIVAEEKRAMGDADSEVAAIPCAILEDGDDADAVEASMIENMARRDADEVTQWESFTRLVKEGRKLGDIADTFGLPELTVRRVLALGNLLPRIRQMYARDDIDRATVRHLTLASKSQQKAWLALVDHEDAYAPTGSQLKGWLFGGQSVGTRHALFDIEASGLVTIADLFGDDRYFADADAFWDAQNAAIEARREDYLDEGWQGVVILSPNDYFSVWEHVKATKRKGGRIYVEVRATGEVTFHEGYLTRKEAERMAKGDPGGKGMKVARPEVTSTMATYIDLHRHAAVRAALTGFPAVALRLMVAHAIVGSPYWKVQADPQTSRNDLIAESIENAPGEADFDHMRRKALGLLGFGAEEPTLIGGNGDDYGVVGVFLTLLDLNDAQVMGIIAIVMGESLASGSAAVDAVGMHIGVDMADYWQADGAFFELLRDREILGHLVADVTDPTVAAANAQEKGKTLKAIVRDALDGTNGREKKDRWVPRWMLFPPAAYSARGGVGPVDAHARVVAAMAIHDAPQPDPDAPGSICPLPDEPEEGTQRLAA